jgi:hypothetical protein
MSHHTKSRGPRSEPASDEMSTSDENDCARISFFFSSHKKKATEQRRLCCYTHKMHSCLISFHLTRDRDAQMIVVVLNIERRTK